MPSSSLFIYAIWIVIMIIWFSAAIGTKRTAKLEHPWEQTVVFLLFATYGTLVVQTPYFPIITQTFCTAVLGVFIAMIGALFAIWARWTLGRNWSGAVVTVKENHNLITSGPYHLVRHPIYTGFLAMALGSFIAIGGLPQFFGIFLLGIAFFIRILREELLMSREFPTKYSEYRKRSKKLIPFIF